MTEQAMRLYKAVERLALQAGEQPDETIEWLCGEHGGMFKLFEAYFSPKLELEQANNRLHELAKHCANVEHEAQILKRCLFQSQESAKQLAQQLVQQEPMTQKWCWWTDSDEHYRVCQTENEAHGEAQCHIDDEHEDGDEVTYYVGHPCHPLDAIMHPQRLIWTGERVFEQIDEWCGDETGAEDWTMDITSEDKEALGKLVFDFLRQNAKVQWWGLAKSHTEHTYIAGSEK